MSLMVVEVVVEVVVLVGIDAHGHVLARRHSIGDQSTPRARIGYILFVIFPIALKSVVT